MAIFYGRVLMTSHKKIIHVLNMVDEMVQNSQSLYSFTFNAVIIIHEYIHSHLRNVKILKLQSGWTSEGV